MSAILASNPASAQIVEATTAVAHRAWQMLSETLRAETSGSTSLSIAEGEKSTAASPMSADATTVTGGSGASGSHKGFMDTTLTPEQQLEALVRDHLDSVYRVAFSVVRDSALAEDVSQDAILKAWNALPNFRGDSSLRSWLLRITHNTAISTLRKRREELRDPDLLPEAPTRTSTESQVLDRFSMADFEEALDKLDELSRSIVVLREIEGLPYDEIAELLEVPLPTVKTRLLRARRVLAAALSDWRA